MSKRSIHYTSYKLTKYNTDLMADIFECPVCRDQINGEYFSRYRFTLMVTCANCGVPYISEFVQVSNA